MSRAEERTEWRFACLIVSSLLFAALAVAVVLGVTDSFDVATRSGINRWASPNLTLLAHALSFIGSVAVLFTLTALTAAGLWLGGRPRAALMLLLVMGAATVLNNVVKLAFARARPEAFFGDAARQLQLCQRSRAIFGLLLRRRRRTHRRPRRERLAALLSYGCSPAALSPASDCRASTSVCTISPM